jgi:hypothetical protein
MAQSAQSHKHVVTTPSAMGRAIAKEQQALPAFLKTSSVTGWHTLTELTAPIDFFTLKSCGRASRRANQVPTFIAIAPSLHPKSKNGWTHLSSMLEGMPAAGRIHCGKDVNNVAELRSRFEDAEEGDLTIEAFQHLDAQIVSLRDVDGYAVSEYAAREAIARYSGWHIRPKGQGVPMYLSDVGASTSNPALNRPLLYDGRATDEEDEDEEVFLKNPAPSGEFSNHETDPDCKLKQEHEELKLAFENVKNELLKVEEDRQMEGFKRTTAEATARSLCGAVEELKEQKEGLMEELKELKCSLERAEHQAASHKRLWSEVEKSQCSGMGSAVVKSEVTAGANTRMTRKDAVNEMPKTKNSLMMIVQEGVVDVRTLDSPYLLFPILVLWQRKLVREAADNLSLSPDHAAEVCAKCQSVWTRYTKRAHKDLLLKHRMDCCPLDTAKGLEKDIVSLDKFRVLLASNVRDTDREMSEIGADAMKNFKFSR